MADALKQRLQKSLDDFKEQGKYKVERVITTPQSAEIRVEESKEPVLNFCANNYLGLSNHPELISAAKKAMDTHGMGLSSVRFICGTQDIHKELEKKIAQFHGTEDAILYSSCFDANAGVFEALLTQEDAILTDALNHASIIDGIRLHKRINKWIFKHMDMTDLERCLKEAEEKKCPVKLIVTDGCFSMDGDVAPLKEICELADKYKAYVFIDECHATGFFGATGRGSPEYCGVQGRIDIINSTLGKALGGASGGYTASTNEVCDMLRQKSRPYLFSNTLAPALVGAANKTFDLIMNDTSLLSNLGKNIALFRSEMKKAGFEVAGAESHPICPVMLYDAPLAIKFAAEMLKRGIYVIGFCFPVVPEGKARIRVQISGAHTIEQVQKCVDAFVTVGKELKVIQ